MRIERRDGSRERSIVIGMVTDDQFLAKISLRWEKNERPLSSDWANLVGHWAADFYRRYGKAPGRAVQGLYEAWADKNDDPDTAKLVDKFLTAISREFDRTPQNPDFLLDAAAEHMNRIKATRHIETAQGFLDGGDTVKALETLAAFHKIELGSAARVDLFRDESLMESIFTDPVEPLITYPGALGHFFQDVFQRDSLIAWMASEKVGKTAWMLDLAYRAVCQRKRVAYFDAGDMSLKQAARRFYCRVTRKPFRSPGNKWPYEVKYPTAIHPPEALGEPAVVEHKLKCYESRMSFNDAKVACRETIKKRIRSDEPYLFMECHANSTLTVDTINASLDAWERQDGFVCDFCIIDYSDILVPPVGYGFKESRDQINATWKQLRRLSQQRQCCVVTATQADADSYTSSLLTRSNFSEDKRKLSHVNALIGINMTGAEKEIGVQRLNFLVAREMEFTWTKVVHVANCLALANPTVCSVMGQTPVARSTDEEDGEGERDGGRRRRRG